MRTVVHADGAVQPEVSPQGVAGGPRTHDRQDGGREGGGHLERPRPRGLHRLLRRGLRVQRPPTPGHGPGGGRRTADRRHRTLRAVVEWSHDLLDPEEAVLFRHLGVFPGSFTLDQVEAVCGWASRGSLPALLARLIEQSLVQPAVRPVPAARDAPRVRRGTARSRRSRGCPSPAAAGPHRTRWNSLNATAARRGVRWLAVHRAPYRPRVASCSRASAVR